MGKGQIVSGGTNGLYSVQLTYERTKVVAALDQVNRWITMKEEQIDKYWYSNPEKIPALKLALESLKKWKEFYESIPGDPTVEAWCADLTEDLTGRVGTAEINGDVDRILIRPGYAGSSAYDSERDGILQHIKAMSPEQWFYNAAMKPGWQKWMPTYRLGEITRLEGNKCDVLLDEAWTDVVNSEVISINEVRTHTDIDIEYMECNGAAFEVGDRVVVEYRNRHKWEDETPVVIGFESEPKACTSTLLFYIVVRNPSTYVYRIEKYCVEKMLNNGTYTAILDSTVNFPESAGFRDTSQVRLISGSTDLNSIHVRCWANTYRNIETGYIENVNLTVYPGGMPTEFRFPVVEFSDDNYTPYQMSGTYGIYSTKDCHLSFGADHWGYYQYYDNYGPILFRKKIGNDIGLNWLSKELIVEWQYQTFPCSFNLWCPCVAGGKFYLAMMYIVGYTGVPGISGHAIYEACIGEWQFPLTDMGTIPLLFAGKLRVFKTITTDLYLSINQILGVDGKIFLLYNHPQDWSNYVWIEVYDQITAELIGVKTISGAYDFTRAGFVTVNKRKYLCTATIDTWGSGEHSNILLIDTETLETTYEVQLDSEYFDFNFLAMNEPQYDLMTDLHNDVRHRQSTTYGIDLQFLGRSKVLDQIAQDHLDWNLANGFDKHEDENGDLVSVRALRHGIYEVAENMILVPNMTLSESIEYACGPEGWQVSPHHFATMVSKQFSIMGWATGVYPESLTEIVVGPGAYNEDTGEYSTTDTVVHISEEYRGKTWLFVVNFA